MQEDGTLLDLNVSLAAVRLRGALAIFLCDDFDLDTIDTTNQLSLENWLALLLATLITRAWAATIETSSDGHAVDLEGFVAVDRYENTVQAVRQCDGDPGCDLQIRVYW
jgi:hypothetical protein